MVGDAGFCCWEDWEGAEQRGAAETWALGEHRIGGEHRALRELRDCTGRHRRRRRRRGTDSRAWGTTSSRALPPGQAQQPTVFGLAVLEPHLHLVLLKGQPGAWQPHIPGGGVKVALKEFLRLLPPPPAGAEETTRSRWETRVLASWMLLGPLHFASCNFNAPSLEENPYVVCK